MGCVLASIEKIIQRLWVRWKTAENQKHPIPWVPVWTQTAFDVRNSSITPIRLLVISSMWTLVALRKSTQNNRGMKTAHTQNDIVVSMRINHYPSDCAPKTQNIRCAFAGTGYQSPEHDRRTRCCHCRPYTVANISGLDASAGVPFWLRLASREHWDLAGMSIIASDHLPPIHVTPG